MKSSSNKSLNHLVILFLILIAVGFLYKRYTDKQTREENYDNKLNKILLIMKI